MEANNEMTLQEIIEILLNKVLIIIGTTVLGGIIAFVGTHYFVEPEYTANIKMYVNNTQDASDSYVNINDINASQKLVSTYVEIIKSETVLNRVIEESGLNYTTTEVRNMMSASSVNGTEIFEVKIISTNPEHSALLANTIAEVAPAEIMRVVKAGSVELVDPATVPSYPSSPNKMLNTIIGLLLGGVLSVLGVLVAAMMDTRIKSEEMIERSFNLPVLGAIPDIEEANKRVK